ncbi:tryptorubin family RiPP precursor [Kitasatospora sp. NPDC091207]
MPERADLTFGRHQSPPSRPSAAGRRTLSVHPAATRRTAPTSADARPPRPLQPPRCARSVQAGPLRAFRGQFGRGRPRNLPDRRPGSELRHLTLFSPPGFTSGRREADPRILPKNRNPSSSSSNSSGSLSDGGTVMKLVHFVKKVMPEKSLKAYAWYGWI